MLKRKLLSAITSCIFRKQLNVKCRHLLKTDEIIFTEQIRRMGEGNVLTCVCMSVHGGGELPSSQQGGGVPTPGWGGVTYSG